MKSNNARMLTVRPPKWQIKIWENTKEIGCMFGTKQPSTEQKAAAPGEQVQRCELGADALTVPLML